MHFSHLDRNRSSITKRVITSLRLLGRGSSDPKERLHQPLDLLLQGLGSRALYARGHGLGQLGQVKGGVAEIEVAAHPRQGQGKERATLDVC